MVNNNIIGKIGLLLLIFLAISIRYTWSGQDTLKKLEAEDKEIIKNMEALEIFDLLKDMEIFEDDMPEEEDTGSGDARRD